MRTRLYRTGTLELSDFDPSQVSDHLEDPEAVVWLDLTEPSLQELELLQEEFQLHPLAVEDAAHAHQRAKIERYRNHFFLVVYAAKLEDDILRTFEVGVFLDERFIITVRKDPGWPIEPVLNRWDAQGPLTKHGVGFLLHGLLDTIVDGYVEVARTLDEQLESVEDRVLLFSDRTSVQQDLFRLRRGIVGLRRITLPMREGLHSFLDHERFVFHEDLRPYFSDIMDHLNRVTDAADSMNELLNSALNLHLSVSSHRLNDIMRKVTSWAAIIGVATTIAGIYGMNFELFPSGDNPFSFWIALGMIGASSMALFVYFRRKEWL